MVLNILIIPVVVPNRPNKGEIVAAVEMILKFLYNFSQCKPTISCISSAFFDLVLFIFEFNEVKKRFSSPDFIQDLMEESIMSLSKKKKSPTAAVIKITMMMGPPVLIISR